MSAKTLNYSPEQTLKMVQDYQSGISVETIAQELNKTVRSVVAKLSREKVYKAKEYVSKTGEKPVKKDIHAEMIGRILNLPENDVDSLTKANKNALRKIFEALANSKPIKGFDYNRLSLIIGFLLSQSEVSTHFAGANYIFIIEPVSIGTNPDVVFSPQVGAKIIP